MSLMVSVTSLITRPMTDLQTDACTLGVGAYFHGDWFHSHLLVDYPSLSSLHINYKEALCIVLSASQWAHLWQNKVVVFCDNTSAVAMLNKGSTHSPLMMTYLRHLFWLSAMFNFRLKAVHIP